MRRGRARCGKLQALGNPNLLILNGGAEDELVDDMTFNTFDPQLYRYTTPDGTQIEIAPRDGREEDHRPQRQHA